jgi:hypothetical protein
VPVDPLSDDAAREQADRRACGRDEAVDADRFGLLRRPPKHRHDHAENHGRGHRATESLNKACGDQEALAVGEPAQQRRRREHREAGEEDPLAADQVTEATDEQQQAAERDQVRVHNPRQTRLREMEIGLDRRKRDLAVSMYRSKSSCTGRSQTGRSFRGTWSRTE